ncbi:hypothetical protein MKW98_005857 [Papaver atlanticum]|uniref:Uncharacterized protein n=1 Tax=Papaver atlanticum TaxID=357466 RepID=A0AAD4TDK3_9MAGN|nr:hypothetical protein MKW98_005857 [Papaver atlanticum]
MSSSIFNKLASSRRMVSTVFTVPHAVSDSLSSLETEQRPPDSVLLANLYQPGHQALDFNLGQKNWSGKKAYETRMLVQSVIGDYVYKHIGLDNLYFDAMFWKWLTSDQRFKDLGVFYKPAPIPDKNEWKASWSQEGKPNWLGTVPTRADYHLCNTAMVDSFIDEGGKGGYVVIYIDSYARPKVAVVGFSPKGSRFFFELQAIRAALQLALDGGYGPKFELTHRSVKLEELFSHVSDFEDLGTVHHCRENYSESDGGDDSRVCVAYQGLYLLEHFIMEDSELLYPVINEILQLRSKLSPYVSFSENLSQASAHLGECYGTPTTEEMKLFQLLDGEYEVYEMVMKPDKFSEELWTHSMMIASRDIGTMAKMFWKSGYLGLVKC